MSKFILKVKNKKSKTKVLMLKLFLAFIFIVILLLVFNQLLPRNYCWDWVEKGAAPSPYGMEGCSNFIFYTLYRLLGRV